MVFLITVDLCFLFKLRVLESFFFLSTWNHLSVHARIHFRVLRNICRFHMFICNMFYKLHGVNHKYCICTYDLPLTEGMYARFIINRWYVSRIYN